MSLHDKAEKNVIWLVALTLVTVSIGGIVELVPLHTIDSTIEPVDGVRPYSPLEQYGRDIYIREGCYNCHSQMIRPFRDEVERYGPYSLAAESMYDHPFQWGSKRTGPDLARVGGRYSNDWHALHMVDPRSVVPASIMPSYGFMAEREIDAEGFRAHLETLEFIGVPYTEEMLAAAEADLIAQATPDADTRDLLERYPRAVVGDLDGNPDAVTELDAIIAYLQILGRMVDFADYSTEDLIQ